MIELRKANLEDVKAEYDLLQKIPAEEDGLQHKGIKTVDIIAE